MDRKMAKDEALASLVILGASGFVGKTMLQTCSIHLPIKAVARRIPSNTHGFSSSITWYSADLLVPESLAEILQEGDIVINLIYMRSEKESDNLRLIDNIVGACFRHRVRKLIHCSTAMVVGGIRSSQIDETTRCSPETQYEGIKYAMEQRVQRVGLDAIVLRPTAIVGVGGLNLSKLAHSLHSGNPVVNYLRACLFGRRKMHLVPVRNVVAALCHLATMQAKFDKEIYFIAADDDPNNNYLHVEKLLRNALGLRPRRVPIIPIPLFFLSIILRLRGCSEWNVRRVYDASKIRATGLKLPDSVSAAVNEFGLSVRKIRNELDDKSYTSL